MSCHYLLLLAEIQVMMWEGDVVSGRGGGVARNPMVIDHRLPLIESTRCLIPPKRDLVPLEREPEFEVDGGSSAAEKPIFVSLLARAICCDLSRCCSTFGGTRSDSSSIDGMARGSDGPWNDRLVLTHNSGEESGLGLVDTGAV